MHDLFSSSGLDARHRYRKWQDFSDERFMPMQHTRLQEDVFDASAQGVEIGDLAITRASFTALMVEATSKTVKSHLNKPDVLGFSIKLAGECTVDQYDRCFEQADGDMSIVDANMPFKFVHHQRTDHLIIQIPRRHIEDVLGPARNYAAMVMRGGAAASLVRSFFEDLVRLHDGMTSDTQQRMAKVGVDLIVAGIAERICQEVPLSLRDNIAVQKAKQYIESNIGDTRLDTSRVAAASGISLRRLQVLFRERGWHIADWIWKRRLDVAAERLANQTMTRASLRLLSYSCGFVNQAHFSRRFRDRFGVSPTEYREKSRFYYNVKRGD